MGLHINIKCENDIVIVVLCVSDLFITGKNTKILEEFKGELHKSFEMTDLRLLHYCSGVEALADG